MSCAKATVSVAEPQHTGNGARNLRHFDRMRQPRAKVIAEVIDEYLRLVLEAAEIFRMHDAVTVALKPAAQRVRRFGKHAAFEIGALGGERGRHLWCDPFWVSVFSAGPNHN